MSFMHCAKSVMGELKLHTRDKWKTDSVKLVLNKHLVRACGSILTN